MSKTRFDFTRGTMFLAPPDELSIIGGMALPEGQRGANDTSHGQGEHDLYDPRLFSVEVTQAEVNNIDHYGVLEPILVVKDPSTGLANVVDGRGRVRRARLANLQRDARGEPNIKVPCVEVRLEGPKLMGAVIAANVRNEDGPLVKLEKAKALLGRGVSEADAAMTFGLDLAYFKALLSYDETATPGVKEAVAEGMLTPTAAMELVRVASTPEAQTEALASVTASGKPATVREARDAAKVASGKANKETGAGLAPSKRELAALMALLAGQNELTVEALVIRDGGEAAEGIEPTVDHVAAAYMHGAEAALALVLGKTTDATLLTLLARARRGLAK